MISHVSQILTVQIRAYATMRFAFATQDFGAKIVPRPNKKKKVRKESILLHA